MATVIDAIQNLVRNPRTMLGQEYKTHNRANHMGEALEEYVKDLFAGSFNVSALERMEAHEQTFSYLGNNSNPPDAMLRNGDAIEVKKTESLDAPLALNSSHPKHKLRSDNPMISEACRDAEDWQEKDILYIVGNVFNGQLRHLAMVYGLDYCASDACYQRLKETIKTGVNAIENVEFAESRELGRVNRVDPLGITYLRIRGMWGIENPWIVFNYIYQRDMRKKLNFMCLINDQKWKTLHQPERLISLSRIDPRLKISDVKIHDPNNPARLNGARLITFTI